MQQTMYQTVPKKSAAPPSASQTLAMVLSTHQIEPELRAMVPRPVVVGNSITKSTGTITAFAFILAGATPWSSLYRYPLPVIASIPILFAVGCNLLKYKHRRHKDLLRHGTPKPAVVTQVETLDDKASAHSLRVTFVYETTNNPRLIQTMTLSRAQVAAFDIRRWKSFTLLVSDRDEYDVEPYFLIDAYKIDKGTFPGNTKTPVLLPVQQTRPGPIIANFGVEPELYCAAPRRVVWRRGTTIARFWLIHVCIGLTGLVIYSLKNEGAFSLPILLMFGILLLVIVFFWSIWEYTIYQSRIFLQNAYAVQATVTRCTGYEYLTVEFEYPRSSTQTGRSEITLSSSEAEQLGGFEVGTRFTVLRHPTESYTVLPYFRIDGVEVPGARPIQTIPPTPRTP